MKAAHWLTVASMAKALAAMNAIFFLTSSKSASGCLNCTRCRACRTAACRHVLAAPVQLAPKVVRPKSSTVRATRSPLPTWPRTFSAGTGTLWKASRAVAVPRMLHFGMRASTTSKPGRSGVTRKAVTLVSRLPSTGVRAITVSTWAMPPLVM